MENITAKEIVKEEAKLAIKTLPSSTKTFSRWDKRCNPL